MLNDCKYCRRTDKDDVYGEEYLFNGECAIRSKQTGLYFPVGLSVSMVLESNPKIDIYLDTPPASDAYMSQSIHVNYCPMCGRKLSEGEKTDAE